MQATESLRKDIAVLVKRYAELQYVEKPFKAGKTVVPPSGKVIGATPIFDDVDLKTYNANVDLIEEEITPKIKAIMLAHTLGNPFNVTKVKEILCERHGFSEARIDTALGLNKAQTNKDQKSLADF